MSAHHPVVVDPQRIEPLHPEVGAEQHAGDDLDALQKELREYEGTSVIVYQQTCAAEKRRRRKRGSA